MVSQVLLAYKQLEALIALKRLQFKVVRVDVAVQIEL